MPDTKKSLAQLNPNVFDIPLMILASVALLIWGLQAPVITLKELVFWQHTFSVISGIENLFREKYYGLGILIILFSVVFPIVISKISVLAKAEPHVGIYIFWVSIVLSMIVVMRMEYLTKISSHPLKRNSL